MESRISKDGLRGLYSEAGRLKLSERVAEVLRHFGKEHFAAVALGVKNLYLERQLTPDPARKCLQRAWKREFPDEGIPNFPRGFWKEERDRLGDNFLSTKPLGVLWDRETKPGWYSGSFYTFDDYFRGELPFWLRPGKRTP